jgi:hypothetical protein
MEVATVVELDSIAKQAVMNQERNKHFENPLFLL